MFSALRGYCVYISFISSHYSPLPFADAALRIPSCNALVIQGRSGSRRYPDSADKSHEKLNEDVPSQARLTQRSAVLVKVDQFHGRKSQIQMHVFIELCYALERMITVSVRMWVLQEIYICMSLGPATAEKSRQPQSIRVSCEEAPRGLPRIICLERELLANPVKKWISKTTVHELELMVQSEDPANLYAVYNWTGSGKILMRCILVGEFILLKELRPTDIPYGLPPIVM
ncbi:hypothetical protein GG344DRAFT_65461 [Lentinula edodes]|nr:hypothetical protein GG344DRAFT_65461 [Lentinula edodes]